MDWTRWFFAAVGGDRLSRAEFDRMAGRLNTLDECEKVLTGSNRYNAELCSLRWVKRIPNMLRSWAMKIMTKIACINDWSRGYSGQSCFARDAALAFLQQLNLSNCSEMSTSILLPLPINIASRSINTFKISVMGVTRLWTKCYAATICLHHPCTKMAMKSGAFVDAFRIETRGLLLLCVLTRG